jgi:hypothetical protein
MQVGNHEGSDLRKFSWRLEHLTISAAVFSPSQKEVARFSMFNFEYQAGVAHSENLTKAR